MRILITGVCGLIGSGIARQLAAQGHELIGNDDLSHNCIEPRELGLSIRVVTCRVEQLYMWLESTSDSESLEIDLIIHCASPVGHARLTPEAQVAWQIISDTQAVLDLAVRSGARLITFSSSEVLTYRGETDIRAQYSLGKLTSEAMVLGHPTVDARVVRPYNVTGRLQRADGGFVMARFRDAALAGEPLTVFGDGKQVRCFTHVADFARFVALLVESWPERKLWSVFNPNNEVNINGIVNLFNALVPRNVAQPGLYTPLTIIKYEDGRVVLDNPSWRDTPARPLNMFDFTACNQIGWSPQVGLEDIVRDHLSVRVEAATHD